MNFNDILTGLLIGLGIAAAAYFFFRNRDKNNSLPDQIKQALEEQFPKALGQASEQLMLLAREKLGAEKAEIKTDLENKRKAIEKLVEQVQKDLHENDRTSQSILQQMKDHAELTSELRVTTDGLKKVLTNNQLRGQFGEQVAEDLLKMAGFVKGVDFEYNRAQGSNTSRPDFCVYLPDKTKINIDVKFPYANLQKATETDDKATKQQLMKAFGQDVREKIRQITTREYINPEDKTVDFVILFVPNEMIFSYIYDKMNDVWAEAMEKKVILSGPFSFTAILRMVRQAYDNFRYQKNIHEIIAHIKRFEVEFEKYSGEFDRLGEYIQRVSSQYSQVETTRTKQLTRVVEKIKLESGEKDLQKNLLE